MGPTCPPVVGDHPASVGFREPLHVDFALAGLVGFEGEPLAVGGQAGRRLGELPRQVRLRLGRLHVEGPDVHIVVADELLIVEEDQPPVARPVRQGDARARGEDELGIALPGGRPHPDLSLGLLR